MDKYFKYKHIVVIGVTGSGKSTLAEALAQELNANYIELDSLFWEPNWTEADPATFITRTQKAIASERWVLAGNYRSVRSLVWSNADAIIWLNYPFWVVLRQLMIRTFRRYWYQEELWNGNHENFWQHFKIWSDESLIHWLLKTYWMRKREYPILFARAEFQHLQVFHLTSPKETSQWLNNLKKDN